MGAFTPLSFEAGGTISGEKPGARIKRAIDELQRKVVAAVRSDVDEFEFVKKDRNTLVFQRKKSRDGVIGSDDPDKDTGKQKKDSPLIDIGDIRMGANADAKVRRVGSTYYLDLTFPRGDSATYGGDEDGSGGGEFSFHVEEIEGGHRITITNTDGSVERFDVMDGAPGEPGEDGASPSIAVTPITSPRSGVAIQVTDADGTVHPAVSVLDGMNGVVTGVVPASWISIDENGPHTFTIEGGALVLTLKGVTNTLSLAQDGTLSITQGTTTITATGPSIASCVNFSNGQS